MTRTEANLWRMAEIAVRSGKEGEVFNDLQKNNSGTKALMLFSFYCKLIKGVENDRVRSINE